MTSPREYAGRKSFNSRCGRKPIRLWLVCSHSGAAGVIAPKLLWPWRWRFFWLSRPPAFRLSLCLAMIGRGRRTTALPLLRLLLRQLALLRRRRLTISALHSLSLGAHLIRLPCTTLGRYLLT